MTRLGSGLLNGSWIRNILLSSIHYFRAASSNRSATADSSNMTGSIANSIIIPNPTQHFPLLPQLPLLQLQSHQNQYQQQERPKDTNGRNNSSKAS
jgi:hypothetical protein